MSGPALERGRAGAGRRGALLLLWLPALAGCHGYLLPFDERPLPAARELESAGGGRVGLDAEGRLVVRPAPGDLGAVLGVGLQETGQGLLVTHRLDAAALLEPEDLIVACAAELPDGEPVRRAHREALTAELVGRVASLAAAEKPGQVPTPEGGSGGGLAAFDPHAEAGPGGVADVSSVALVRARAACHPVRTAGDLRGYLTGAPWVVLDLVVRRGEAELVVRQPVRAPEEWFPVPEFRAEVGRWHGLAASRLGDWPPERRPAWAAPEDLVIVRVVRDAPAARAGLRPLDVVPAGEWERLLQGGPDAPVRVRAADGAWKSLPPFAPREAPRDLYLPLLFSYERDGARAHLGLGPGDLLWHWSSQLDYDPHTDTYEETWRWSAGTSIQGAGVRAPSGTRETAGINLFLDGARLGFASELARTGEERARRTGQPP